MLVSAIASPVGEACFVCLPYKSPELGGMSCCGGLQMKDESCWVKLADGDDRYLST